MVCISKNTANFYSIFVNANIRGLLYSTLREGGWGYGSHSSVLTVLLFDNWTNF